MNYAALQREHIAEAGLNRRQQRYAPRCHAAVITAIEAKGLGIFDMSLADIVALVMSSLSLTGIWGFLFSGVIRAILFMLVPRVINWLKDKLSGWLDRNQSFGSVSADGTVRMDRSVSLATVDGLAPIFSDARRFMDSGRWE